MRMLLNGHEQLTKEEFAEIPGLAFPAFGLFNDVVLPTIGALTDDGRVIIQHGFTPWFISEYKRGSRIKTKRLGTNPRKVRYVFTVRVRDGVTSVAFGKRRVVCRDSRLECIFVALLQQSELHHRLLDDDGNPMSEAKAVQIAHNFRELLYRCVTTKITRKGRANDRAYLAVKHAIRARKEWLLIDGCLRFKSDDPGYQAKYNKKRFRSQGSRFWSMPDGSDQPCTDRHKKSKPLPHDDDNDED